jgi:hypothetical protein
MASWLSFPDRLLSWFERLSAFQAIPFGPRGYESTKWAYSLWRELFAAWFDAEQLFHQSRQLADTGEKWKKCTHHRRNSPGFVTARPEPSVLPFSFRIRTFSGGDCANKHMLWTARKWTSLPGRVGAPSTGRIDGVVKNDDSRSGRRVHSCVKRPHGVRRGEQCIALESEEPDRRGEAQNCLQIL